MEKLESSKKKDPKNKILQLKKLIKNGILCGEKLFEFSKHITKSANNLILKYKRFKD